MIAGLLALTVIALSAAGIAVRGGADASRQHAIALSRQLAAESLAANSANPLTARRLAVAAWKVFPTGQAGSVLANLLMEQQQRGILPGNPAKNGVSAVAFSPDGKLLASAGADGTVRSGRCRFSPIRTQHCVPMSGRRQRQIGRTTPRANRSPASADDTCSHAA